MKHLLIMFSILLFSFFSASAQKIYAGLELGSNIIPIEKSALGNNFQIGPYAGFSLNYNLSENLRISSGLFFSQRKKMYLKSDTSSVLSAFDDLLSLGGNSLGLDSIINIPGVDMNVYNNTEGIATENYIELPIMLSYKHKNLIVSAGPYFGFLMNGKKKEEIRTTAPILQVFDVSSIDSSGLLSIFLPPADETKFSETSSIDNLKRMDIGGAFGIGYQINNLKFNLNYTLGFNDYRINQEGEGKSTHKAIRISINYYFGEPDSNAKPSL